MIVMKSQLEIEYMREAGRIVAEVHDLLKGYVRPSVSTKDLDDIAEEYIRSRGAIPAFKGYGGFPASICTSVNNQVVHGIPGKRVLEPGDIISIDVGTLKNGFHGDGAKTYPVGEISEEADKLIRVTRQSFYEGLKYCSEGYRLSDISHAVQVYVESNGFSVVRDFVGHGIGAKMHEDPQIPNYGLPGKGPRLQKGMVLAIEPMVNIGGYGVKVLSDKWTVETLDASLSAHYEHTIAITDNDPIILTCLD